MSSGATVPVSGACSCVPPPPDSSECGCEIGTLIDELTRVAYWAEPAEAADAIRNLIRNAPAILARQNAALIVRLAADWKGTSDEFEQRFGYSRGRLHQMGVRWRR